MEIILLLLGSVIVMVVPAYVVLQIMVPMRLQGPQRRRALFPLFVMIPLFIFVIYSVLVMDKSMGPMWLIAATPFGVIYLLVVWLTAGRN